jgi:nucleoside transporter
MSSIRFKLSVMMFLEFFIWGAWLPKIFGYLGTLHFDTMEKALVMNAFAIASILAMFFSNQFADRYFAAEKFLAFSQLVGGLAIIALTWVTDFWPFFWLMLVHSVFYVPTISITNSIAFANLREPQKEFGPVRLWGTIGWIAASWPFVFILSGEDSAQAVRYTYLVAGIASLLLAGFSFALPHTPPRPVVAGEAKFAWLEAGRLLRISFVAVLFLVTFVDSVVHTCYFIFTDTYLKSIGFAENWVMPVMSVGQIAEIGTMAILGYCLKALGWRYTMVLGILGHAVRFALFAFVPIPAVAVAVNLLHGICYAFFFATVYIFVDEFFPKDARSSAQGLFNFQILGLGPLAAYFLWPYLGGIYTDANGNVDFHQLFLIPAGVAFFAAAALFLLFHPPDKSPAGLADAFRQDEPGVGPAVAPIGSEAIRAAEQGIQKS